MTDRPTDDDWEDHPNPDGTTTRIRKARPTDDRCPRCGSTDPAVMLPAERWANGYLASLSCNDVIHHQWHDRPTACPRCGSTDPDVRGQQAGFGGTDPCEHDWHDRPTDDLPEWPRSLTSSDPEPPVGTMVATDDSGVWQRFSADPGKSWTRVDDEDDVETWTRVAGNYGPVYVVRVRDYTDRDADRDDHAAARIRELEEALELIAVATTIADAVPEVRRIAKEALR